MSSYQTFEQAETKTFRPKKHSVMIAAVMVAAFWLGAACVSTTSQGPAVYGLATGPGPANVRAAAPRAAANGTCTKAEFQRDVALDVTGHGEGIFGTSNDKQTLVKSFKAKGLPDTDSGLEDIIHYLHVYDATTGEEKRDPILLKLDAAYVAITNANDVVAACYSGNMYGIYNLTCLDRVNYSLPLVEGNDPESCYYENAFYDAGMCSAVVMAPDEQTVAFANGNERSVCIGDSWVRLHDISSPQEPLEFNVGKWSLADEFSDKPNNDWPYQACSSLLAYAPDGTLAVAGMSREAIDDDLEGLVAFYDGTTGELLERVVLDTDGPFGIAALEYSNDGQMLAIGGSKTTNRSADWIDEDTDVLVLYDVSNKAVAAEIDLRDTLDASDMQTTIDYVRVAWSPDDKYIVGGVTDWKGEGRMGVFDAATGMLLDDFSIDMPGHFGIDGTDVDFMAFTGQCGDACQELVVSSTVTTFDHDNTPWFSNNLNFYDVMTLDADDARCQPTPAPVPQSDGAKALVAGVAVPTLAALAL